jgi:hypothetical protein
VARWTILDPFNQPLSPFSEEVVADHLVNHGDCYVLLSDGSEWELASEALNRLQLAALKARIPKQGSSRGLLRPAAYQTSCSQRSTVKDLRKGWHHLSSSPC